MKNLTDYNDFKNKKQVAEPIVEQIVESVEEQVVETTEESVEELNEGAQLFDNTWKVRTRVEIPTSLINAYVKKVQQDTGEDPRKKWSEQELAEEITKYVTTSYLTIENLPTTIVANASAEPKTQTQEEMPAETQVQAPAQGGEEVNVQIEPAPQGQPAPAQGAEAVAQTVPQAQKPAQAPAQKPAQTI
jgi:glucan-binding YG repeat protein